MKTDKITLKIILLIGFFVFAQKIKSTTYFLQATGNLTVLTSWNTNPAGGGSTPGNFTSGSDVWELHNVSQPTVLLTTSWNLNSNATVNFGDGTNATTLIYSASGRFGSSSTEPFINFKDKSIIVFQKDNDINFNRALFQPGSTAIFDITTSGSGILDNVYENVKISKNIFLGDPITINGTLTIDPSIVLSMNLQPLVLKGTIAGSGKIFGDASASIIFTLSTASGNFGNLNFETGGQVLNALTINLPNLTDNLSLGTSLSILDSISIHRGTLFTNSNLTLTANSSLSGRIGLVGSSGLINGNVTVQTFLPGTSTGWALLGSNGVNGVTVANTQTQIPMTCVGCINDPSSVGGFQSIQRWDEVTESYITAGIVPSTQLTIDNGYWIYVGSSLNSTTPFTLEYTGPAISGNTTIPVTQTGSKAAYYNLITNPYSSPISWTKLRALGTNNLLVGSTMYGFNADGNSGAGASTFFQISGGSSGMTDVIPAGQAFFVDAVFSGGLLDFDESIKVNSNTSANPVQKNATGMINLVKIKLTGNSNIEDVTFLRTHLNSTSSFDPEYDSHKMLFTPGYVGYPGPYNDYTTISSRLLNRDYAVNSVPPLTNSLSIEILVRVMTSGIYTISAADFEDFNSCLILKDKLTNTTTDLKLSNYVFTISDTTSAPRFELILCKDESLNAVGISESKNESQSIFITQDAQGAFVKTVFEKNTKASISVYNIIGQKLIRDISVEGTVTNTQLPIDLHNQVVLIKVTTDKESVTKKLVLH